VLADDIKSFKLLTKDILTQIINALLYPLCRCFDHFFQVPYVCSVALDCSRCCSHCYLLRVVRERTYAGERSTTTSTSCSSYPRSGVLR